MLYFVCRSRGVEFSCVAAIGAIHFSVRGFGHALFVFKEVHTMNKVIEALYCGNIAPLDKKLSPKEIELLGFLERHKETVQKGLDAETQIAFQKFEDCFAELMTERELEVFKQGFKLGMCFAIEGTDIQSK